VALRSLSVAKSEVGQYNLPMHYVYILKSEKDGSLYKGSTSDIKKRLAEHNSGNSKYSSSKKPFKLIWYGAFLTKKQALEFEIYIKSGSGHAFTNKHLI